MEISHENIIKLCGFYISNWHLATMILPYINSKINEKANVITILENNVENNITTLIEKLNLQNKKSILDINWKNTNSNKYSEIKEKLDKQIKRKDNRENILFVNGSKEYIDLVNKNIEKWVNKNIKEKIKIKIKIIDCYEVTDFNENILEILDKHDKILNTSGEKDITDIFEGYKKKEKYIEDSKKPV